MKEEYTAYQQSLMVIKPLSIGRQIYRWCFLVIICVLAFGFYCQYNDLLPSYLAGILILLTGLHAFLYWVSVIASLPISACNFLYGAILENDLENKKEDYLAKEDKTIFAEKTVLRARAYVVDLVKNKQFLSLNQLTLYFVLSVILECTLFAFLLIANHPLLAFFQSVGLTLQFCMVRFIKAKLRKLVKLLPDPLEENEEIDYDDLIDKLCDPNQPDLNGPKE